MTIYKPTANYRKIWSDHFGPIPKDEHNRSYEIHHIDGDRSNNDISNLKCVSMQEHYDIHFSQGDWGACSRIAIKMQADPKIISDNASRFQKERVKLGVHPFLKREDGSSVSTDVKNKPGYVNPFSPREDGSNLSRDRVLNGTHHMLRRPDGSSLMSDKTMDGRNPLSTRSDGTSVQQDLVMAGTHHRLRRSDGSSQASDQMQSGSHPWVLNHPSKKPWHCDNCGKDGQGGSNFKRWHSPDSPSSCYKRL